MHNTILLDIRNFPYLLKTAILGNIVDIMDSLIWVDK